MMAGRRKKRSLGSSKAKHVTRFNNAVDNFHRLTLQAEKAIGLGQCAKAVTFSQRAESWAGRANAEMDGVLDTNPKLATGMSRKIGGVYRRLEDVHRSMFDRCAVFDKKGRR